MIAMVMIFMLSVMGISVMRSATLGKRMTANAIQTSTTLQAAESATERMLNSSEVLSESAAQFRTVVSVETEAVRDDIPFGQTSEIVYLGNGPAIGFSSDFMTLRFVAQGDTRIDAVRSRSIVRQGAERIVPAL